MKYSGCGCGGNSYREPEKPKIKVVRRDLKRPKKSK
jgi:hypothetical protein